MSTKINLTYMYITKKYIANKIKKKLTYLKYVLRKATKNSVGQRRSKTSPTTYKKFIN